MVKYPSFFTNNIFVHISTSPDPRAALPRQPSIYANRPPNKKYAPPSSEVEELAGRTEKTNIQVFFKMMALAFKPSLTVHVVK